MDVETIDRVNILQATLLAMEQAVYKLPVSADYVLVDGNRVPKVGAPRFSAFQYVGSNAVL